MGIVIGDQTMAVLSTDGLGANWTVYPYGDYVVVFWDTEALGAMVFHPLLGGERVTFPATGGGRSRDLPPDPSRREAGNRSKLGACRGIGVRPRAGVL